MEATGKYDFKATGDDELSFRRGDQIKILQSTGNWYKAEINGAEGFVPKNFIDLQVPSWFLEDVKRSSAREMLMSQPAGVFLIRSSQNVAPGSFSISVRCPTDVQHFKVMRDTRGQYYVWSEKFPSLNKLVDFYKVNSLSKHRQILLLEPQQQERRSTGDTPPGPAPRHSVPPPVPLPRQPRAASAATLQVRALYNFHAEEADELEFSAGDVIQVVEHSDPMWWKGRLRGRTGLFPATYAKPV